jgi:hypothetical protein
MGGAAFLLMCPKVKTLEPSLHSAIKTPFITIQCPGNVQR